MPYPDLILSSSSSPPFKSWILSHGVFPWVGLGLLPRLLASLLEVTSGAQGTRFYGACRHLFTGNRCFADARWLLSSPVQSSSTVKASGNRRRWAHLVHHKPGTSELCKAELQGFSFLSLFLWSSHFVAISQPLAFVCSRGCVLLA